MTTLLEHSDHILNSRPGEVLLVTSPVRGVNMARGGSLSYAMGARLRVKVRIGGLLWCLDENANTVTFSRTEMKNIDRAQQNTGGCGQ